PCVFISVPNGASAGTVLRPGLIGRLLDAQPDAHVVLFSPLVDDPAFAKEFGRPGVTLEPLPPHTPQGLEARLVALMQASYLTSSASESVRIRFDEARRKKSIRWLRTKRLLTKTVAPSMARPGTRYDVSDRLISHPWADAMFDRY